MSKVDSEYLDIINKALEQIIAIPDGTIGMMEDFLGQKFDTFTLLSIGSTVESMLREHKIWLKFEGEYDCFQCKYKFPFQKGTEFFLTVNNVFAPQDNRYIQDNALVEKYEIHISKDVTVNGRVTFLTKKDNRKITINCDFTKEQNINISDISSLLRSIQQSGHQYQRIPSILDDAHYDKTIVKINSVEYLFDMQDSHILKLTSIIRGHDMYQAILQEKQKGVRNGLYPTDL